MPDRSVGARCPPRRRAEEGWSSSTGWPRIGAAGRCPRAEGRQGGVGRARRLTTTRCRRPGIDAGGSIRVLRCPYRERSDSTRPYADRSRQRGGLDGAMDDFPGAIVPTDHVEPAPRRVRGDARRHDRLRHGRRSVRLRMAGFYPQYYIPIGDVDRATLVDEGRHARTSNGAAPSATACGWASSCARAAPTSTPRPTSRAHRHCALRLGRPRPLVRGGRGDLRPSAQSLRPGRRPSLHPHGASRARRRGIGRVVLAGGGVRDRSALPLLPEPHRDRRVPPGPECHGHPLPVQGNDHRLLVGRGGRSPVSRTSRGPTTSRPASSAHRRTRGLLQRAASTSPSTAVASSGPRPTSPDTRPSVERLLRAGCRPARSPAQGRPELLRLPALRLGHGPEQGSGQRHG